MYAASLASPRSGFGGARTGRLRACNALTTGVQNDASAKPPWTRTTVGLLMLSVIAPPWRSLGYRAPPTLGPPSPPRVRQPTCWFGAMTYVIAVFLLTVERRRARRAGFR